MSAIESRIRSFFFHLPSPCVGQSASAVSTSRAHLRLLLGGHEVVAGLDRLGVLLDARWPASCSLLPRIQLSRSVTVSLRNSRAARRVAPVAEGALGELHDVALVHEGHALALELAARSGWRRGRGARCPRGETGLMPMPLVSGKRIFLTFISSWSKAMTFFDLGRARGPLDAGVDVLRVLAEDHHVDVARALHRARHAREPADRAQADVEVEHLAQRHVQRADAAADRRGERPLDADQVLAEGVERLVRQPLAGLVERPSRRPAPPARRSSACRRRPSPPRRRRRATDARQMSRPVPSPSMKGMIGRSGTLSFPSDRVIGSPAGDVAFCMAGEFTAAAGPV